MNNAKQLYDREFACCLTDLLLGVRHSMKLISRLAPQILSESDWGKMSSVESLINRSINVDNHKCTLAIEQLGCFS